MVYTHVSADSLRIVNRRGKRSNYLQLFGAVSARTYATTNPPSCDTLACSVTGVGAGLAFGCVSISEGFECSPDEGRNDRCFQLGRNVGYKALYAASLIAHLG